MSAATSEFRGVLLGAVYADPEAFEKAAKALGYRRRGQGAIKDVLGMEVAIRLTDGTRLRGQVWARHPRDGWVWIACEDRRYYALDVREGEVMTDVPVGRQVGKVAAA